MGRGIAPRLGEDQLPPHTLRQPFSAIKAVVDGSSNSRPLYTSDSADQLRGLNSGGHRYPKKQIWYHFRQLIYTTSLCFKLFNIYHLKHIYK